MTRFEMEINGQLGDFWKRDAEKRLDGVHNELANGEITIDENGVARNCIGRVVTNEVLEMLMHVTDAVNAEATKNAEMEETAKWLEEYRRNARPASPEELYEMRAAFGEGAVVVDVLTGEEIRL